MDTAMKLQSPDRKLPPEVWECVISNLNHVDSYHLAIANKFMWELVRHSPNEAEYNINTKNNIVPSYFLANTKAVKLIDDNVNYKNLEKLLSQFYHISIVDFSKVLTNQKAASKLLFCIPQRAVSFELQILVDKSDFLFYENAINSYRASGKARKIALIKTSKKREAEEGIDELKDIKKMRLSSPVRRDVEELMKNVEAIEDAFGSSNSQVVFPDALKYITYCHSYEDSAMLSEQVEGLVVESKKNADKFADKVCGRLVEAIVKSSDGSWLLITQVEAYLRGNQEIDDCANNTITINHPNEPVFLVEQKREFKNQWYEAKIYFGEFEFLITGCLQGRYDNDQVGAFLGASLGKHCDVKGYWRVYIPTKPNAYIKCHRLLRNFTRKASGYKWLYKSKTFVNRGFETSNPLLLHTSNEVDFVSVGSFVLHSKLRGTFSEVDAKKLKNLLKHENVLGDFDLKLLDTENQITKYVQSLILPKGKSSAALVSLMLMSKCTIADAAYINLYKSLIFPRLSILNKNAIKNKKYLT